MIDRPVRPLFPDGYKKDLSVVAAVMSADRKTDPDTIAMIAASAALSISEVPFLGPIGAVRVGRVDGNFIINPVFEDRGKSDLDLVIAATGEAITMVEASAREVEEQVVIDGLEFAHNVCKEVVEMINDLVRQCGKETVEWEVPEIDEELREKVRSMSFDDVRAALRTEGKHSRKEAVSAICNAVIEELCPPDQVEEGTCPDPKVVKGFLGEVKKKAERDIIIKDGCRTDGRDYDQIRAISTEVAMLPCAHGSSLFTRGETQALATATLGTGFDEQRIDGLIDEHKEHFMLHYNFPAYCVGESWPNRGPKRREIGHGTLAERALRPILPDRDDFPYTIRIVSDVLESNGSSSMATVCGGTLAMMDAGVKISRPVAGIAMGLVQDGEQSFILSDILGSEDAVGDMDFKVAGTQKGITAIQMDIKIKGMNRNLMAKALEQARTGRLHILRKMLEGDIDRPRSQVSPHAPKVIRIKINPEKIGIVIGPGGKMIKGIQEETGAKIDIEDDGTVTVWGKDLESATAARERIDMLTEEVEIGRTYDGRVVSIKDFGCFVEVLPGQEGLVHVSELAGDFIDDVSSVVSRGDDLRVKVLSIDPQGRMRLSHKAVLVDEGKLQPATGGDDRPPRGSRDGGGRDGARGGGDHGGNRRGPRRDR